MKENICRDRINVDDTAMVFPQERIELRAKLHGTSQIDVDDLLKACALEFLFFPQDRADAIRHNIQFAKFASKRGDSIRVLDVQLMVGEVAEVIFIIVCGSSARYYDLCACLEKRSGDTIANGYPSNTRDISNDLIRTG